MLKLGTAFLKCALSASEGARFAAQVESLQRGAPLERLEATREPVHVQLERLSAYSQGAALIKQGCGGYSRVLAQRQQVE